MWQLVATIISFLLIPICLKKNLKLSSSIFISTMVLGLISGIGANKLAHIILGVFINSSSRDTILTIIMISILGGMMKHYKVLDRIVDTTLKVIENKKIVIGLIPAIIGMIIIPGGAILSAPFVYNLGEDLKIPPARRAAINLTFRHVYTYILPYSTMLLLIKSSLPHINLYKLIALNLILVLATTFAAYLLYLKDIEVELVGKKEDVGKNLIKLLILSSPIYLPVLLNLTFNIPFYLSILVSLVVIYFLGDKKDFLRNTIKSLNFNVVATLTVIVMMKDIILNLNDMLGLVESLFIKIDNDFLIWGVFLLVSLFFGIITGNSTMPLAVTLPILSIMKFDPKLIYIHLYFLTGSAFLGYYFSPIHLCQVFTLEEMGVATGELYKEYRVFAAITFIILIISSMALLLIAR